MNKLCTLTIPSAFFKIYVKSVEIFYV